MTSDHRFLFKASSLEDKQQWVKSLRTAILYMSTQGGVAPSAVGKGSERVIPDGTLSVSTTSGGGGGSAGEVVTAPSPAVSPYHTKKDNIVGNGIDLAQELSFLSESGSSPLPLGLELPTSGEQEPLVFEKVHYVHIIFRMCVFPICVPLIQT